MTSAKNVNKVIVSVVIIVIAATVLLKLGSEDSDSLGALEHTFEPQSATATEVGSRSRDAKSLSLSDTTQRVRQETAEGIEIVYGQPSEVGQELRQLAEGYHLNADRMRYVQIDKEKFIELLRFTPAYMYAESGNRPAPPSDELPQFSMTLFEDKTYGLSLHDVTLHELDDYKQLTLAGQITNPSGGVFRFTVMDDGRLLSGFIDTEGFFTRIDTWKVSDLSVVAEYSRATVNREMGPID